MPITIHIVAAIWVLVAGTLQIALAKGTSLHKAMGWSWMIAMLVVAASSFWITGFIDWAFGYGPLHLLSLWVIFCVGISVYSARTGNIRLHKAYAVGAFIGAVGAGLGAVLGPGRVLNKVIFG